MRRRFTTLILSACVIILFYLVFIKDNDTHFAYSASHQPHAHDPTHFVEPSIPPSSPIPNGIPKPPGSNYTRALVLARTLSEDVTWVDAHLSTNPLLTPYIYTVDDPASPLTIPQNKGHEAMVYLTYLIDHYDSLPEIIIFMHGHRNAWHNNEIFNYDAVETVGRLRGERVVRLGYMNLRCHWEPGCPDWIVPRTRNRDGAKREERVVGGAWRELFPGIHVPGVLGQACCAQFAVSRERVERVGRRRFVELREWLLKTGLEDELSGRVFEWVWQFIFTESAVDCPSMRVCYCDGFGVCFHSAEEFDRWFELKWNLNRCKEELEIRNGMNKIQPPDFDAQRDAYLEEQMTMFTAEMNRLSKEAMARGKDPETRALVSGSPWREFDGS